MLSVLDKNIYTYLEFDEDVDIYSQLVRGPHKKSPVENYNAQR